MLDVTPAGPAPAGPALEVACYYLRLARMRAGEDRTMDYYCERALERLADVKSALERVEGALALLRGDERR